MDLYATGFNARRQLDFEATARHGLAPNGMEPCDKYDFTRILTGESIERPFANFAGTTGVYIRLSFVAIKACCRIVVPDAHSPPTTPC